MAIKYEWNIMGNILTVFLENKTVGVIMKVERGFQYFPKGSGKGGEIFKTIQQVKNSLQT